MNSPEKLWLIGTSEEIRAVRDEVAAERDVESILLPDGFEENLEKMLPLFYPVKGQCVFVALKPQYLNALRVTMARMLKGLRVEFESIISDASQVSRSASVGKGVFIGPGCAVGSRAVLADFCVLEEHCNVGRGAEIRQHAWLRYDCSVGPGSILGPRCVIGPSVEIAAGEVGADCEISIPGRYTESIGSRTHFLPELGGPIRRIS